ncbi:MAG: hypothetical protein GY774_28290, partial [Planctomycetes bacterium]|nr:hypothetical protein [Planctomycetota bacterium]
MASMFSGEQERYMMDDMSRVRKSLCWMAIAAGERPRTRKLITLLNTSVSMHIELTPSFADHALS